jgi:hypothetical protein
MFVTIHSSSSLVASQEKKSQIATLATDSAIPVYAT